MELPFPVYRLCRLDMIWPNLMPISVRSYRLPIQVARQGGGDFSLAPMIGDVVVSMLEMFCDTARRALSECDEGKMLDARSGSLSESMAHNISVAGVMVRA